MVDYNFQGHKVSEQEFWNLMKTCEKGIKEVDKELDKLRSQKKWEKKQKH